MYVDDTVRRGVLSKNLNASTVDLVVFFTLLTGRASTIPSNIIRDWQSGKSAGQEKIRENMKKNKINK